MFANAITCTFLNRAKIPITADTEKKAIEIAVKTCWKLEQSNLRLLIMKNTLDLEYLYVSKAAWEEIKDSKKIEACGDWEKLSFNHDGKMKIRF